MAQRVRPCRAAQLNALHAALLPIEERAIDSGVVDDALPLSTHDREAMQLALMR